LAPDLARDVVLTTAVATIYGVAGLLALAAAWRWRESRGRIPALLLAWAMLQHALNQISATDPLQVALGGPTPLSMWTSIVTGHFVAVPWAMLIERVIGPGWKSTVRRTWQVYMASAAACVIYDIGTANPGAASEVNRAVVGVGAVVGFANLFFARLGLPSEVVVLRVGILAFMALVVHDAIAGAGLLPWQRGTGPLGVLICVTAIAYTALARTVRGQRELRAMEHELATARRIQASLLPETAPDLQGATVVFRYVPAAAVAGDVFDFLAVAPRHLGILVADVSGHGVPAALIASMVKVAAAAQEPHAADPGRVLEGIHLALAGKLPGAQFVTAAYVFVDLDRGLLRHASAGHPPALVWRAAARSFVPINETGPLIISFAPPRYPLTEVALAPGDRVVLYTDGITEAMRADEEMFGVERLREIVAGSLDGIDRLASSIIDAAMAFRGHGDSAFEDDCTLVMLAVGEPVTRAVAPGVARER
jgi:serine phosphatase RsbU (regulator of sigma subunit)